MLITVCANSINLFFSPSENNIFTEIHLKGSFGLGSAEDGIVRKVSCSAWRLNIGFCAEEGMSDVSGVSLWLPWRQFCPCCALGQKRGKWAPCRSLREGLSNIRVTVRDFRDLSKCSPSYLMHLLLSKLFRVTMREKKYSWIKVSTGPVEVFHLFGLFN